MNRFNPVFPLRFRRQTDWSRVVSGQLPGMMLATALAVTWPAYADSEPDIGLPKNQWALMEEGGLGLRAETALLYVPATGRFLAALGRQNRPGRGETPPYSEMTFCFRHRRWENALPKGGSEWGAITGPVQTPDFAKQSDAAGFWHDKTGVLRPQLRTPYGIRVDHLFAYDSDRQRVLFGTDMEYDPAERVWRAPHPQGHPGTPSLAPFTFGEDETFGPAWSQMCYDPVNREFLLFGGTKTVTESGAPGTWSYCPKSNKWRKLSFGSENMNRLREAASLLRRQARTALAACRNRHYGSELPEYAEERLVRRLAAVLDPEHLLSLTREVAAGPDWARGYERTQLERTGTELAEAVALYEKLLAESEVRTETTTEILGMAAALKRLLRRAEVSLSSEPPPRCYSPMVFDEESGKIVLFGGYALSHAMSDTWLYDPKTRTWEERRPAIGPTPRLGHGMVFLPQARKVLLVGGWQPRPGRGCTRFSGETLVPEAWTYDVGSNAWTLIRRWDVSLVAAKGPFPPPGNGPQYFAADENDTLLTIAGSANAGGVVAPSTWACRMDVSAPDMAGTAEYGVPFGTEHYPGAYCSPDWYDKTAPPPDFRKTEAELAALPINKWVRRPAGGVLRPVHAYCTVAFDTHRDEILAFVGGHGTWHGADVGRYSLSADRWHTDHYAHIPLSFGYFATGGTYGYGFRPWMGVHTWGGYAYDPALKKLVVLTGMEQFTFAYDSDTGAFDRPWTTLPPGASWMTKACATPRGIHIWTRTRGSPPRLWRLDTDTRSWVQLGVAGEPLPEPCIDRSGLTFDSRRNRLLLMPSSGKGDLFAYDLDSGRLERLEAAGKEHAPGNYRDARYSPKLDIVFEMMGSAYDVGKNAWVKLPVDAAELVKGFKGSPQAADNTQGLAYDPKRDLFWAVNGMRNRGVFVLRLERSASAE